MSIFQTTEQNEEFFNNLFDKPTLIIDSSITTNQFGGQISRVISIDSKLGAKGYYDKKLLSPGGEFMPYSIKLFAWLFALKDVSFFIESRDLTHGAKDVSTVNFNNRFKSATIVCSELFSPSLLRLTAQDSDIITVLTSNSIFRGSETLIGQNLAIAKFRAAENQRPLLLSANGGLSYAINSLGNVTNIARNQDQKLLTGSIAISNPESWYNKQRDNPILLGSLVLASTGILRFRLKRKN